MKIALLFILYYYLMNLNSNYQKFEPFSYKTLRDLEKKFQDLNLNIPISKNTDILRENIEFKNIVVPNRLLIQPMEGFDANEDGSPGELTLRRYNRYSEGGAGTIWFEATSVAENCRSNPHQLMLTEKNVNKFKHLTSLVRKSQENTLKSLGFNEKGLLIIQLNHSGRYSQKNGQKFPIRSFYNRELDNAIKVDEDEGILISDEELSNIQDMWLEKALLAKKAGFDGVDIKACHGYLISELLSSRMRKDSMFGGISFENRSRLFLNIMNRLHEELKNEPNFLITTRLGVFDGIPYPNGFGITQNESQEFPASIDLTEPLTLIKRLYKLGVTLINISAGNPHYKAYITRPFDTPVKGTKLPDEHPLYSVNRIINLTSEIKKNVPNDVIIIGSGYSYLRQYAGYIAAGLVQANKVDICGFGRMSIANPNFPKQLFRHGYIDKNQVCITCSKCSEFMRQGKTTGCAIRDPYYQNKV